MLLKCLDTSHGFLFYNLLIVQTCICNEFVEEIGLTQPTISQHLKELKNIGLINGNIEGSSYCIDPVKWKEVKSIFTALFNNKINLINNCR